MENGKIRCEIYDGCVLLYEKFRDFEKLIVYSYDGFDSSVLDIPKGTICDALCTQRRPVDERLKFFLEKAGFETFAVNCAGFFDVSSIELDEEKENTVFLSDESYIKYAKDVHDLWNETFDSSTLDLLPIDEIEKAIRNSKIILSLGENDELAGCLLIEDTSKDTFTLRHLCTNKKYLRKGIGSKMMKLLLETAKRYDRKKVSLFVNEENINAIKLYEKFGLTLTGIKSVEFIEK